MKKWILEHKKLYFLIVGFIAFLAFTIITLIGLGKVYDAEAATDNGSISVPYGESSTYSLGLRDYPYYVVFTTYLNDTERFVAILSDEPMTYGNGFSDTDLLSGGVRTLYVRREKNGDGEYVVSEEAMEGNMSIRYLPQESSEVYSNYDIMRGSYEVVFSANPLPVIADYVFDLDNYFSSVVFEQSGTLGSDVLWTMFFDMKPEIIYPSLANYYIDVSYRFVLPSLDFLQDFADFGVSAWSDDAVDLWRFYSDEKRTFDFSSSYNAPQGFIPVSDFGSNLREKWQSFYGVPFDEELFQLALRYSYPQVTALYYRELKTDGDYHLGPTCVLHSYEYYLKLSNSLPSPSVIKNVAVNTHGVPIDYIISVADVSSKNDYDDLLNRYQQEVQKNEEFEQALKDAQSEVQRAEEALKKAHEDMGLSGFLGVFEIIAKGFETASDAVSHVAEAVGNVFNFFPSEITACLCFVFVFLLFVAIYHGLKG